MKLVNNQAAAGQLEVCNVFNSNCRKSYNVKAAGMKGNRMKKKNGTNKPIIESRAVRCSKGANSP
jgi:hypothetical protein